MFPHYKKTPADVIGAAMQRMLGLSVLTLCALDLTSCGGNGDETGPAPEVASLTVTPGELTLAVGESHQLTGTARDQAGNPLAGRSISWATSVPTIATVSTTGMGAGVSEGSATITATLEGKSGSATVSVGIPSTPIASITVSPAELTLLVGESQQLTAVASDEAGNPLNGRSITWTTTMPTVATVSGTGMVTGAGAGSTTITATSEGKSGSATISIASAPVASVTISPGELTLLAEASQKVTATT